MIMSLDQAHQAKLMVSIDSFMKRGASAAAESGSSSRRISAGGTVLEADRDRAGTDESPLRRLSISSAESTGSVEGNNFDGNSASGRRVAAAGAAKSAQDPQLAQKVRSLEAQLAKATAKADGAIEQVGVLESQVSEAQDALKKRERELEEVKGESVDAVQRLEEELRLQADELDISRSKLIELSRMEAKYTKLRKRIEDSGDYEQRVRELEILNEEQAAKVTSLEKELGTLPVLQKQLAALKSKLLDAEMSLTEANASLKVRTAEVDKQKAASRALEDTARTLRGQLQTAKEEMANLEAEIEEQDRLHGQGDALGGDGARAAERIARLEAENAALKSASGGNDDAKAQIALLEAEVAKLNTIKGKLEEKKYRLDDAHI